MQRLTIRNASLAGDWTICRRWQYGKRIHRLESRAMNNVADSSQPSVCGNSSSEAISPQFSLDVRVYYEDTDAGGVVYYANYLRFFERCRTEWVRALGYDQSALAQTHDLVFVVRHASATYFKPARLDDLLTIDVRVLEMGRSKVRLEQRASRKAVSAGESDVLLVVGEVEIVCVQLSTFKAVPIPALLKAKFQETV